MAEVILVHGLWFGAWSMYVLAAHLEHAGFRVRRFNWSTTGKSLEDNAVALASFCGQSSARVIHLAGHSMGGLLILRMLQNDHARPPARVLFMGTPLLGCEAVRRGMVLPGGKLLLGQAAEPLVKGCAALPPDWQCGMIAGKLPFGLGIVTGGLQRPHDGTVMVAETSHPDLSDRVELPVTHTGLLYSGAVARQADVFLRTGHFHHRQ